LTPFTCHVTALLVSPVTVAVNWAVEPSLTWAPPLTVTCGCVIGGPFWPEPPHPANPSTPTPRSPQTSRKQLRENRSPIRVAMPPSNTVL
jgi:hypothetical protein